jgi:hypothetical protein
MKNINERGKTRVRDIRLTFSRSSSAPAQLQLSSSSRYLLSRYALEAAAPKSEMPISDSDRYIDNQTKLGIGETEQKNIDASPIALLTGPGYALLFKTFPV